MAAGDCVVFDAHLQDLARGVHNLETGDISMGLIDNGTTPTAGTAAPAWGNALTTDFSADEVTPGGNYSADGPSIGGTASQTSGTLTFDVTDVSITQNGSNPTNARWGIIYNETASNNEAIGYIDLGAVIDLSAGDFSITWSGSGFYTIS